MSEFALNTIKRFVAGDMTPQEFQGLLYSDDAFEALLTNESTLSASNYVSRSGSTYHFVISQDYDDPGDILNAQGALCDFMDRNKIDYSRTERYSDFYCLILEADPGWIGVDSKYVAEELLPHAGNRSGSALKEWLTSELTSRFRYVNAPPEWIQSPAWPISKNGPLIFLGQLEIEKYFHDDAMVYVFHDQQSGCCETIIQVY